MVEIASNNNNTLHSFERFLGRDHNDETLKDELSHVGYAVEKLCDGTAGISVDYNNDKHVLAPVQIISMLLVDLKARIEKTMNGQTLEDCVIGCPNYWGNRE